MAWDTLPSSLWDRVLVPLPTVSFLMQTLEAAGTLDPASQEGHSDGLPEPCLQPGQASALVFRELSDACSAFQIS